MKQTRMEEAWGNPSGGGMARAGRSGRQAKRCPNWRADKEEGKSPDRSATNRVAARRLQVFRYEEAHVAGLPRGVVMLEESSTA
jgi:hypothetical protein